MAFRLGVHWPVMFPFLELVSHCRGYVPLNPRVRLLGQQRNHSRTDEIWMLYFQCPRSANVNESVVRKTCFRHLKKSDTTFILPSNFGYRCSTFSSKAEISPFEGSFNYQVIWINPDEMWPWAYAFITKALILPQAFPTVLLSMVINHLTWL